MNKKMGKYGSLLTGLSILSFAISMIIGIFTNTIFFSCLSSMFIAIGFIPFMVSIYSVNEDKEKNSVGLTGIAFSVIYAVLVFIVYYAECSTIRLNDNLSETTLNIISYEKLGSLFFNYDLLGYAFMALSTFFISFTVKVNDRVSKYLKVLLMLHGIFFIGCLFMPMFPIFKSGTNSIIGTIILEIWCLYFLPICILGYKYFCRES